MGNDPENLRTVYIILGILLFMISVTFLILNIIVIMVFLSDAYFRRMVIFRMMLSRCINDSLQLIIHTFSSILVVCNCDVNDCLIKIIGAVLTGLWFLNIVQTISLTLHRLIQFMSNIPNFGALAIPYSEQAVYMAHITVFLVATILKFLPYNSYVFIPKAFTWGPLPDDRELSVIQRTVSKYLTLFEVVVTIVSYCISAVVLGGKVARISRREFVITLQIFVVALYTLFTFVFWTYLEGLFNPHTVYVAFVSCLIWVGMNGINPVIYFIFNKRLKRNVYGFIFRKNRAKRTMAAITTVSNSNVHVEPHLRESILKTRKKIARITLLTSIK